MKIFYVTNHELTLFIPIMWKYEIDFEAIGVTLTGNNFVDSIRRSISRPDIFDCL